MKERRYEFDNKSMSYRDTRFNFARLLSTMLKIFIVSLSLFVVLYYILATFISTDTEKRLTREIRAYEKAFPSIPGRSTLLEESIVILEIKDNDIYNNVFHNEAPSVDPIGSLDIFWGADTIPNSKIVNYTSAKVDRLMDQAAVVRSAFDSIFNSLSQQKVILPPMALPVDEISYPQIGASLGSRLNPTLKASVFHNGLDLIVPSGTQVRASASAEVEKVVKSTKGHGNTVLLKHSGGYQTLYCHLSEIKVKEGQSVVKGQIIGISGMSGDAFAPHLHYELMLNGKPMDPVNYFFSSVSPKEYSNMLYMSKYTLQSMD